MEEHVCFREVDGGMHACLRNDHCWLRVASMPYVSQCHALLVVVFYTSILEDLRGCTLHCVCTRGAPVFIPSVWKIQTPPWVQVFFWLLYHNKLMDIDNLIKRNIFKPLHCQFCDENESIPHLFFDCIVARNFNCVSAGVC